MYYILRAGSFSCMVVKFLYFGKSAETGHERGPMRETCLQKAQRQANAVKKGNEIPVYAMEYQPRPGDRETHRPEKGEHAGEAKQ